ncbi:hypothetical protein AX16_001484 [Volvariella volvacea WC 439]|nr:hypothetical protein AX16_001484 [Volvariella volvacea WC 439]
MYTFLILTGLFYVLNFLCNRSRGLPFPPGPRGKFLIGNIWDLPKHYEWMTYKTWARIYDPNILYLNLSRSNMIVLNSIPAAEELLERRSAIYSGRPRFTMISELMGWGFASSLLDYGATWRQHRKFMHQSFHSNAVAQFKPHILKSTHTLMQNILSQPDNFGYYIWHMTAEAVLLITYGIQVQLKSDPIVELAERAMETVNQAFIPGRFLVDTFPWLKYIPSWVPFAEFQLVRDDILSGKGIRSLVSNGLRDMGEGGDMNERENIVKHVAGTLYGGRVNTTVAAVMTGILAFMCYPDVLRKAQAEMDTIVRPGNLLTFSDKQSLPYLSAIVKEIFRWSPVLPLGVPHYTNVEDVYNGYRIPANSVVFTNIWAMFHNEDTYPDPRTFNPERFTKNGKLSNEIQDPERIVFGFGRRICPGRHFASLSVWMSIACLVALFDISKPLDEEGNTIEPTVEWTSTAVSHPVPFKCKIAPRSDRAVMAIQSMEGYEYFDE